MNYQINEIPLVSESYSHQNDETNSRVICSSSGEIKILNCDPVVLEEVLSYTNGINTFGEIESKFIDRYPIDTVRNFLNVILDELES